MTLHAPVPLGTQPCVHQIKITTCIHKCSRFPCLIDRLQLEPRLLTAALQTHKFAKFYVFKSLYEINFFINNCGLNFEFHLIPVFLNSGRALSTSKY